MPPLIVNFSRRVLEEVFRAHGIYVIETYPDGQVMWGDRPMAEPYEGKFCPAAFYMPGRYSIYTIRGVIERLGKRAEMEAIEKELFPRMNED